MITSIARNFNGDPNMVTIITTDNTTAINTNGYWASQSAVVEALNNGEFQWLPTDFAIIYYSSLGVPGIGFYTYDATTDAFEPFAPASLSPSFLRYTTVNISSPEFLGMYAAPKLLIPAPGVGLTHVLDNMYLVETFNSVAYGGGGTTAVQYDSTVNGAGILASTTHTASDFTAGASTSFNFNAGIINQPFATCVNKGLYLSNITGAFTLGNSPFVAHIWYKTIPVV